VESWYDHAMSKHPSFAEAWLRQREEGRVAVAQIEARELEAPDQDEALRQSDALLAAVPLDAMPEDRRVSSGFVEQQRLFLRTRR
jgi:hypothetical protein